MFVTSFAELLGDLHQIGSANHAQSHAAPKINKIKNEAVILGARGGAISILTWHSCFMNSSIYVVTTYPREAQDHLTTNKKVQRGAALDNFELRPAPIGY